MRPVWPPKNVLTGPFDLRERQLRRRALMRGVREAHKLGLAKFAHLIEIRSLHHGIEAGLFEGWGEDGEGGALRFFPRTRRCS